MASQIIDRLSVYYILFLIVSTFMIQKQLDYIQYKNLGYAREHVILLPAT